MLRKAIIVLLSGLAALAAAGCTTTDTMQTTNDFTALKRDATILLIEPDIELRHLQTAGVSEVRADWSELGKDNLLDAMERELAPRGHRLIEVSIDTADPRQVQIVKLHEVVGDTIFKHRYLGMPLPTKKGKFDWSLGPGVIDMAGQSEADYALFLFVRGEYASTGRKALAVGLTALGGVIHTGGQAAYASLIDLETGDVVWFNIARAPTMKDMRKPEGAAQMIETILTDFPL